MNRIFVLRTAIGEFKEKVSGRVIPNGSGEGEGAIRLGVVGIIVRGQPGISIADGGALNLDSQPVISGGKDSAGDGYFIPTVNRCLIKSGLNNEGCWISQPSVIVNSG
jgi:hypothetical protein